MSSSRPQGPGGTVLSAAVHAGACSPDSVIMMDFGPGGSALSISVRTAGWREPQSVCCARLGASKGRVPACSGVLQGEEFFRSAVTSLTHAVEEALPSPAKNPSLLTENTQLLTGWTRLLF